MRIVITAGHGGTDPGAIANGYTEAAFCADMRNYVAYYLRNRGLKVETDGQGPTNAPLAQAIALAKSANVAVEFHLNASMHKDVSGVEVLSGPANKPLAQKIAKAISLITGSKLRGDHGWRPENAGQHSRLGFVRAGGMIVELDFVTNADAMAVLNEKRWHVAKAIAETIFEHLGG